jgi:Porin PorA
MRRFLGPILFGLGAFLLVAGLLLKFYAYPRVAVAPIDQNSVTKLQATGAEVFDTTTLKPITTDLSIQSRTVGDVKASEKEGNNVRVWVGTTSIRSDDGVVRSRSTERSPFDATTAEAVNCCGAFDESTEGERTPVKRTGLVWKWPFDTQKKDYKVWDGTLGEAVTAKYVKESSVKGLKTYEFKLTVPRTKVGTTKVPASVVGGAGTANVEADNMYSTTNTYQIEPYTGAIVTQSLASVNTLAVDGEDKVTTTKADIQYTPATVASNVSDFKSKASLVKLVRTTGPIIAGILGLVLLVVGFILGRRSDAETDGEPAASRGGARAARG